MSLELVFLGVFIGSLFLPIVFVVLGILFMTHSPKNRYGALGWRTRRARQSWETWEYANKFAGKNFLVLGIILFALTIVEFIVLGVFIAVGIPYTVAFFVVLFILLDAFLQVGSIVVIAYRVEHGLKKRFG